jgi:DNA-binding NtrC family response regulator
VKERILVVDDVPGNIDVLGAFLESAGFEVLAAASGEKALALAARARPALLLLDVIMPGLDGFETCQRLKSEPATADIPVMFITARDDPDSLAAGFRAGGVDYITKPFNREEVLLRVKTHVDLHRLTRNLSDQAAALGEANRRLREEIERRETAERAFAQADDRLSLLTEQEVARWGLEGFIGRSPTLGAILQEVRRLQDFPATGVLITGESGTGKELIARALHFGSPRSKGPFIPVNCSAVPGELAESLFFGHRQGAFSGANRDRKGYFELANGGTIFLDEVGDMPVTLQAKLLRVLEDGAYLPLGAEREVRVDVRVVAATNVDLDRKIAAGGFRADLFYRLARFTVCTPPLRERQDDIPLLASHFMQVFATEMNRRPPRLTPGALASLMAHPFPGNVRELKNVIERALIASGGGDILAEHLHLHPVAARPVALGNQYGSAPRRSDVSGIPFDLDQAELVLIRRAIDHCGGNIAQAARLLGVPRMRIYRRLGAAADPKGASS